MESYEEQLEVATRNGHCDLAELGRTWLSYDQKKKKKKKRAHCGLGPFEIATSI